MIGTDTRTLVQVLGAIFVVLFPQLGTVAELDPLLAPGKDQNEGKEKKALRKNMDQAQMFFYFSFFKVSVCLGVRRNRILGIAGLPSVDFIKHMAFDG